MFIVNMHGFFHGWKDKEGITITKVFQEILDESGVNQTKYG